MRILKVSSWFLVFFFFSMLVYSRAEAATANLGITQQVTAINGVSVVPGETEAPVGATVEFTVYVRNAPYNAVFSNSNSTNTVLRELFSGPFTVTAVNPSQGTCNFSNGSNSSEIFCTVGSIALGSSMKVSILGTLDDAGQVDKVGVVQDTYGNVPGSAGFPKDDLLTIDNVATASVVSSNSAPLPNGNLVMIKSVDNLTPVAGVDTVTYTLSVLNTGANSVSNIIVTDVTFGDVTMNTAAGTGWTCNMVGPNPPSPPNLTGNYQGCTYLGPLAAGAFAPPITISGTVNSVGPVANVATVDSLSIKDIDESNNSAVVTLLGVAEPPIQADLSVTKSVDQSNVSPGDFVTYTISVNNSTNQMIPSVLLTDKLVGPQQVIAGSLPNFCALTVPAYDPNVQIVTCIGNNIESGVTTFTYQAEVTDLGQGDNIACIGSSSIEDVRSSNNCAVASFISLNPDLQRADLQVRKSTDVLNPQVGDIVKTTLQVKNAGPYEAISGKLTDTVFGNIRIMEVDTSDAPDWDCTVNQGQWLNQVAYPTPLQIRCDATDDLPVTDNQNIVVTGVVTAAGPITDSVTVSASGSGDPNLSDNTAAVTVVSTEAGPVVSADLSIEKNADVDFVQPGEIVNYTVTVTNNGTVTVEDVIVQDVLLGNFVPVAPPVGCNSLSNIGDAYYCGINGIVAGGVAVITYSVKANAEGVLSNVATVLAPIADPVSDNNTAAVNVAVNRERADLQIVKSVDKPQAKIGEQVTFTIRVSNTSPGVDAKGVNISDIMSGPMQFDSATLLTGGTCIPAAGPAPTPLIIDCNPGNTHTIAAGSSALLEVKATVLAGGQSDNLASVASNGTADSNMSNNTAVASVITSLPVVDLSITKSVSPTTASVGETVTFNFVVTNPGPEAVKNVVVTDHVSGPISNIGNFVVPGGGVCNASPAPLNPTVTVVTCSAALLPVGSFAVTYTGEITGLGQIDNLASISGLDAVDRNPSNNSAVASVNGTAQLADLSVTKSVDNPNASIGDIVEFTIQVVNDGPNTASEVRLTDVISGPLSDVVAPTGCSVDESNPPVIVVKCDLGAFGPGETETLVISGEVVDLGQVDNIASVADLGTEAPTQDPDLSNNSAVASVVGNEQEADLSVIKEANPPQANVGETVTFISTVENLGPATLPPGQAQFTEVVSGPFSVSNVIPPAGGTCSPAVVVGNITTVKCSNTGNFNSGSSAVVQVEGQVTGVGAISNTVSVGSEVTSDPDLTNNTATADVNGTGQEADLSLVKEVDISQGSSVGDTVVFTVTVRNSGAAATNVVVTDQLIAPQGVFTVTSLVSTQGTCNPVAPPEVTSPAVFSCTIGPMDGGDTEIITLVGRIDGVGQIENTAVVTDTADPQTGNSPSTDPNASNNISVASAVAVPTQVDLSILKEVDLPQANPNEAVTFTVVVTNQGSAQAKGVTVSDLLTGPFKIDSMTVSGGGTCSPNAGNSPPAFSSVCTPSGGNLAAGSSMTITMVGHVTGNGQVDNTASVASSGTQDPNPSNNTAVASTLGVPQAVDVSITKTVDHPQAVRGESVTFTVTVKNLDPVNFAAQGLRVTDLMTGPIEVQSVEVQGESGAQCQTTPSLPAVAQPFLTLVCTPEEGKLGSGDTFSFTVVGTLTDEGQVDNVASVDTTVTVDPDQSNNTAVASVVGALRADLRIVKSVLTPQPVSVGDMVTYQIQVFNDGPNTATDVAVTDMNLGPFTAFENISDPAICVLFDDNNMSCALPDIPAQGSVVFTYNVSPNQSGFWFNLATVSTDISDPNLANNTISANLPVEVTELADLEIDKSADQTEVKAGDTVTYTLLITNHGPQTATEVVISDFTSGPFTEINNIAIAGGGSCQGADQGLITCEVPALAAGAAVRVTYQVVTDLPGILSDLATVGGGILDPAPENNADAFQVRVLPRQADLEIFKNIDANPVQQYQPVQYTLVVTNHGPDRADEVWVVDQISGQVESVTAQSNNAGACEIEQVSETNTLIKCELGDMESEAQVTVTVNLTPMGEIDSVLSNLASVSSQTEDPRLANNTTTADALTLEGQEPLPPGTVLEGSGAGSCQLQLVRGQGVEAWSLLWILSFSILVVLRVSKLSRHSVKRRGTFWVR